jgi:hypothetical protein
MMTLLALIGLVAVIRGCLNNIVGIILFIILVVVMLNDAGYI